MQKKDAALFDDADEDYDDFSDDAEDDDSSRTYVPLNQEETAGDAPKTDDDDSFTPLTEKVSQAVETVKSEVKEKVEEFFDEDSSEEAEGSEEFFSDEETASTEE
jgi:hypothetical protein